MTTTVADLKVKFSSDGADRVKRDITDLDGGIGNATKRAGFFSTALGTMGGVIGAGMFTGLVGGIKDIGLGFISSNSQLENFKAQLEVATGSAEKAEVVMKNMRKIAASSPFEFPELVQAAQNLEAFGISSEKWIPTIGNTAAATGKSVDQVTQALMDAQTGEFERLKELGIRTQVEGDKVRFSFMKNGQMMTVEAANTAEGIESALMGIWDDKYDGAMDNMSDTWTGKLANLKDNIGMIMQDAGKPIFELAKKGADFANGFLGNFQTLRDQGKPLLDSLFGALRQSITAAFGPAAGAMFFQFSKTLKSAFKTIGNVLDEFKELAGDIFGGLADNMDIVIPAIRGVALAFGGLLIIGGIAAIVGGALALITSPLFLIAAAAAALSVAWSKNWGDIQGKTAAVAEFIVDAFQTIKANIDTIVNVIAAMAGPIGVAIMTVIKHWDELVSAFKSDGIMGALRAFGSAFMSEMASVGATVLALIDDIVGAISRLDWGGFLAGAWNVIQDGLEFAWQELSQIDWSQVIGAAVDVGQKILDWAKETLGAIDWGKVVGTVTSVGAGILNWAKTKLGEIAWGTIVGTVTSVGAGVLSWAKTKLGEISWSGIVGELKGSVGTSILNWAKGVLGDIKWSSIVGSVTSVGAGVLNWVKGVLGSISWTDLFGAAIDLGASFLAWLTSTISIPPFPGWPTVDQILNALVSAATPDGKSSDPDADGDKATSGDGKTTAPDHSDPMKPPILVDANEYAGLSTALRDVAAAAGEAAAASTAFGSASAAASAGAGAAAQTHLAPISGIAGGVAAALLGSTVPAFNTVRTSAASNFGGMLGSAVANFSGMNANAAGQSAGMAASVSGSMSGMRSNVTGSISGMAGSAAGSFASMQGNAQAAGAGIASGIGGGTASAVNQAGANLGRLAGTVSSAGAGAALAAYSAGTAIGAGLANGIDAMYARVAAAGARLAQAAAAAIAAAAQVKSPSRVTMRLGRFIGQGLELGIRDMIPSVERAAGDLVNIPQPGMLGYATSRTSAVGMGGSRSLSIGQITINQQPGEDSDALLDRLFARLEGGYDAVGGLKG